MSSKTNATEKKTVSSSEIASSKRRKRKLNGDHSEDLHMMDEKPDTLNLNATAEEDYEEVSISLLKLIEGLFTRDVYSLLFREKDSETSNPTNTIPLVRSNNNTFSPSGAKAIKCVLPNKLTPSSVPEEWACRICTLLNPRGSSVCIVCASSRFGKLKGEFVAATKVLKNEHRPINNAVGWTEPQIKKTVSKLVINLADDDVNTQCAPVKAPDPKFGMDESNICIEHFDIADLSKYGDSVENSFLESKDMWNDVLIMSNIWKPIIVEFTGRRFGEKRKGKNKLLGNM